MVKPSHMQASLVAQLGENPPAVGKPGFDPWVGFISRHIHSWALLLLWPNHFLLSGVISNCLPLFPSSILDTSDLGGSSSGVISFCLFILPKGFSEQEYWSGLPSPPPVDRVLSECSIMTLPSWVALHGMAHSFNELCRPLCHDKAVIHEGGLLLS